MELIIKSPSENDVVQPIVFNYEEIVSELAVSLKKYEGITYTDDAMKSAKADRATLNKFVQAIDNRRKEIKKQCMKPYDEFESKIKEIVGMVDKQMSAIDGQVKAFDEKQKEEKRKSIETFFNANIGDLRSLISLSSIWNEKWLNATVKMIDVSREIMDKIAQITNDLKVIGDLKSEFETEIKNTYLQSLNLSAALSKKTQLEQQKASLEEYNRQKSEQSQSKAQYEAEEDKTAAREEQMHAVQSCGAINSPSEEVTKTIDVRFYDTTAAFRGEMRALTEKHNIKYGGVQ